MAEDRGYPLPPCEDDSLYAYLDTAFVVRDGQLAADPWDIARGIRQRDEEWIVVLLEGTTDAKRIQRWVNTNLWGDAIPSQALRNQGFLPSASYYTISAWGMALIPLEPLYAEE